MYVDTLCPPDTLTSEYSFHSFIYSSLKTDLGHDYFLSITVPAENNLNTVTRRNKTCTSQNPKHVPESTNVSHYPKPFQETKFWGLFLDSGKWFYILGCVLDLRSDFKFHKSFRVIPR